MVSWLFQKIRQSLHVEADMELFAYLEDIINNPSAIRVELDRLESAKKYSQTQYHLTTVSVYFALERYILSHDVKVSGIELNNRDVLRSHIATYIKEIKINRRLRVVFMTGSLRKMFLYELYLNDLVYSFTRAVGHRDLEKIAKKILSGSALHDVVVDGSRFDFSATNKRINNLSEAERDQLLIPFQDTCRIVVHELYDLTTTIFGEEFADKAGSSAFEGFAKYYDYEVIRSLLSILPTVISERQRLAFLSREELESEVEQTAKQLVSLEKEKRLVVEQVNQELEKKVKERTKDLQKFQLAVESATDHIIITEQNGTIIYANKATETITGYSREEIIGKTPNLWGGDMTNEFYDNLWSTIKKSKKSFKAEVKNCRKDGESYIAEVTISPILDEDGEAIFFVGIERDVTKEKQIADMKSEFISVASHQLRTPLTEARWAFHILLEDEKLSFTEEQKNIAEKGLQATTFTIGLINDLLDITKIEAGQMSYNLALESVSEIAAAVCRKLEYAAKEKNISLIFHDDDTTPNTLIDPKQLEMAVSNLIDNAIKYTPAKGSVTVSVTHKNERIHLAVTDTGIGIPSSQLSMLFTKFFRAKNAKLEQTDGSGLGLYIAKKIIEAHDGEIKVESDLKKGTTFTVTLPNRNTIDKTETNLTEA